MRSRRAAEAAFTLSRRGLLHRQGGGVAHHHRYVLHRLQRGEGGGVTALIRRGDRVHRRRPVEEQQPDQLADLLSAAEGGDRILVAGDPHRLPGRRAPVHSAASPTTLPPPLPDTTAEAS